MKQVYTLITIICSMSVSHAQSVRYEYNDAGNRILRSYENSLPVTLTDLAVISENSAALLTWYTVEEADFEHFGVERSPDGKNWTSLGNVPAKGGGGYFFTDETPLEGQNLYRLKLNETNGTYAYSRYVSLDFTSLFSVYPNPVRDRLTIAEAVSGGKVAVVTNAGETLITDGSVPGDGLDLSGLLPGVYLLQYSTPGVPVKTVKIIKE